MTVTTDAAALPADTGTDALETTGDEVVLADVLIEEISIDGMCGVY